MENNNFMRRAIELARMGAGHTSPNPMVGAVVVDCDGAMIGEGYHAKCGQAHAEVNAINDVQKRGNAAKLSEATIYVTLEPCSHFGKTPPCADLIINSGIKKVVVGSIDPNEKVAGRGIEKLRRAGVEVRVGVNEAECRAINLPFFTVHEKKRPYVILKWAQSSDKFLDIVRPIGSHPAWMTGDKARQVVHRWRAECDAIMVGRRTVELDNPQLTVRDVEGHNPLRVVTDRYLQLDVGCNIFDADAPTLTFTERASKVAHTATCQIDYSTDTLPQILNALLERGVQSVMVEGGAQLLNSFISSKLWDEARVFTATQPISSYYSSYDFVCDGRVAAPRIDGCRVAEDVRLGLVIFRPL
ncbi:MAG: bifunctional diaminohydroxyphosphoribosylaminopyrimidine deaminase/5-amino-6-(5-phosphoribosylamino)uracil reductase RibD [Mucinivorans sp.]